MIYKNIANTLRVRIGTAEYEVGSALPGENRLASEFGVSRMTVRKAIDLLVGWGLVFRKNGSGTYIIHKNVYAGTDSIPGFFDAMKVFHGKITSDVLAFKIQPATEVIAAQLHLANNEQVYYSRRLRFVNSTPLMLEDSYMPVRFFKNLTVTHLEGSKFKYIEKECHISIGGTYECLTPVLVESGIASLLNIKESTPILCITSLTYSRENEFINYSIMYRNTSEYREDRYL
ncbi:GntR family transcriptional regulator [Citrobacter rodentium]|uniref:Transcriptional regulator n=2 Tax=Citrobacter rodentium TaxID=67825 RepID=D2THX9_CITRI|nr:GntR family transcriptional regulator [Citrobacter rodentium]KIQ48808.1 GntR family transcriptional regulator [Citrobacter rodentium]QBY32069.1 GntR family transcriptional regulator [Citrobacter rodentium]UHO33410.1 GntR family transcriptional regulator [Citrobacter rodentium NBRC 105723 = DSM 16636]CBG90748.1 putative transcriptional regulator [Citrobacter rodentium ICC168]HAT8014067.1 GntR family transcriptional regulator [Citrobacter rodentium NBRC 105723 = DSM 16636]